MDEDTLLENRRYMKKVKKICERIARDRWEIGFVEDGLDAVMGQEPLKVNWLKHGFKDRWFADPFILEVTEDTVQVLVEEFLYQTKKGRIALLEVDRRSFELQSHHVVLELETHLSFPAIWRENGKTFIYPESWQSGALCRYELKCGQCDVGTRAVLCEEPMADAIMTDRFGKRLLFSVKENDRLRVYDYDSQKNRFVLSFEKPFDKATARNGGDFFEYRGEVFRAAQVCIDHYGEALEIQKVVCDGNENFCFIPVKTLRSNHESLDYGMHTLNTYKGIVVIDVHGWNNAFVINSINALRKIPKTIHYCWFGDSAFPDLAWRCLVSWHEHMPDWKYKLWNEDNFDVNSHPYTKEAYEAGQYAFVSDYVRLYALEREGGVYLDVDFEVFKSFEDLLDYPAFAGFEGSKHHPVMMGVCASVPHGEWISEMLCAYEDRRFVRNGKSDLTTIVQIVTSKMSSNGFCQDGTEQDYKDLHVFPVDYFCPRLTTGEYVRSDNTYCEHLGLNSWARNAPGWKNWLKRLLGQRKMTQLILLKRRLLG